MKNKVFTDKSNVIGSFRKCDMCGCIPLEITYNSADIIRVYHCSDCNPKEVKMSFKTIFKLIFK